MSDRSCSSCEECSYRPKSRPVCRRYEASRSCCYPRACPAPVAERGGIDTLRWVPASNGYVPPHAVPGGEDLSRNVAYVGRAKCQNFLLPGRVVSHKQHCYVALYESDNPSKDYEVLTNPENAPLKWVSTKEGSLLPGAVPAGDQRSKTMYIGRRQVEGFLLVGKVHHLLHELWVPISGNEKVYKDYELLVCEK